MELGSLAAAPLAPALPLLPLPWQRPPYPEDGMGAGYFQGIRRKTRKFKTPINFQIPEGKPDFKISSFIKTGGWNKPKSPLPTS